MDGVVLSVVTPKGLGPGVPDLSSLASRCDATQYATILVRTASYKISTKMTCHHRNAILIFNSRHRVN